MEDQVLGFTPGAPEHPASPFRGFLLDEPLARRLLDELRVGILIQGPRAEVLYCNRRGAELLGLPDDQIIGRTSLEATALAVREDGSPFPGSDHPAPQVLATGRPVRGLVMGWRRPDRQDRVWLLVDADAERAPDGTIARVVCTFTDITADHEKNEQLRASEARYRQLVEKAQDIMYRTDVHGFFTYVNPVASRVVGWPADQIVGKHFLELIREDHRARVEARLRAQFKDATPTSYDEFVAVTRDGSEIWVGQNVQLVVEGGRTRGFQAVARDITARKRAELAAEREREQLLEIVTHAPVSMAVLDRDRRYVAHSRGWRQAWRLADADLRGRVHGEVLRHEPPAFRAAIDHALEGEVVSATEELVHRHDGSSVYMSWTVHPWRRGDAVEGVVAAVQDIDVLVRARQAAEEATRLKSEFLANVSHELRTPLSGALGMTRLLLDEELPARQREYVEAIRDSGRQVLDIVDDILDFSRLEAGRLPIECVDVDPRDVLAQALRSVEAAAAKKGLALSTSVADDVPAELRGDPIRLRQALLALLSNAVKFTSEGAVVARVSVAAEGAGEVTVRFEVTDTGIGMPAEVQARLFQPFTQGDGSLARRYGGAGLGLTLCRRLVEAMRGEIGFRSAPGRGSAFWFAVPLVRSSEEPRQAGADAIPRRLGSVLVVEDNRVNQRVAVAMLDSLGYDADVAANGIEALAASEKKRYDAILMDCQMPEMDGFKATAFLRERECSGRRTPIIAVTASIRAEDRDQCLAAGMDDYLGKPIHLESLGAVLGRWIRGKDAPGVPPLGLPPEHPLRRLEAQAGTRVFIEVVDVFLQTIPRRLEEMRDALRRGDGAALRALAHSVKGASAQMGARGMADLCTQIQAVARGGSLSGVSEVLTALEDDYRSVSAALLEERRRAAGKT